MFDYHMHTAFSADSRADMDEMVQTAIQQGLKEICFTEHIDYDYPDDSIVFDLDYEAYTKKITEVQEKYRRDITVKKGVELGIQPHLFDRYDELMSKTEWDFVICSMHTVENKSLHYGEIFEGRTLDQAFEVYYDEFTHCIQHFKEYNILGHVDLIKRYSHSFVEEKTDNLFHDELAKMFDIIIPEGKGIELNTSGVRYGLDHNLAAPDVLRLYHEMGGEVITVGSDAHRPSEIAFQFKESLALLKDIGFKYITTFENRKPTFHSIDSLHI